MIPNVSTAILVIVLAGFALAAGYYNWFGVGLLWRMIAEQCGHVVTQIGRAVDGLMRLLK
jgi:hypothetical protein